MAKKRACRYGKVKSGPRKGRCRKRPVRGSKAASRGGARKCRYGRLKNPVGKRVCKKRPRKGRKKSC